MKKLFTLMSALLLWQTMAVAQNYLHISSGDSVKKVQFAELDSVTVRNADFYKLSFTTEGLNGLYYTGEVPDAWENNRYTFNIMLAMGDGNTIFIHNLDPYFAQYGYIASSGYNILMGELAAAEDGQSATLTCQAGQSMGYNNAIFITPNDLESPIVFTITETTITCETGYGVYEGGFYSAFYPFTLMKTQSAQTPQKAPQLRDMTVPLQLKAQAIQPVHISKQEGKTGKMMLQPYTTREIVK